jgi:hypothetical protein
VWLFGPYPLAFVFAAIARARGVRVVLGVRQDLPRYVANRHPGRRAVQLAATALEHGYRRLARRHAAVVVGPDLARNYADAGRLLDVNVSLVRARDVAIAPAAPCWETRASLQLLSVGRLDAEKNPAMLADVLAGLRVQDPRWRLTVCGEGGRRAALEARAAELGVGEHIRMLGYVAGEELAALYRESDAFLHVSWTEGVPQVLFEAFAAGLPVVGTAVGRACRPWRGTRPCSPHRATRASSSSTSSAWRPSRACATSSCAAARRSRGTTRSRRSPAASRRSWASPGRRRTCTACRSRAPREARAGAPPDRRAPVRARQRRPRTSS